MDFANKEYLLLLLLLIPYVWWYVKHQRHQEPSMRMSDTFAYQHAPRSLRTRMIHLPAILRGLVFALVVIVLARPQSYNAWNDRDTEGIDIMMAMDISISMLAEDVAPNRIEVAKDVAKEFIADRQNDNIGLTVFAGEAFTQCPMTTDHAVLLNMLQGVRTDLAQNGLIESGTAIGMGLANAVSRLKDSKAKSKVVILLTDGSNNVGDISPMTAAEIAKQFGVRVYTIGFGTDEVARYPVVVNGRTQYVNAKGEIDYKTLNDIADATNGHFYRATNRKELSQIYKDIDKLEKTKMKSKSVSRHYDVYEPFALAAALLLLLEILMRTIWLRRLP